LVDNFVEVIGAPRTFIRGDYTNARISNNRLVNTDDANNVPNMQTGARQGLRAPLSFKVGVNGQTTVSSNDLIARTRGNP
jgi:hypothetical protein